MVFFLNLHIIFTPTKLYDSIIFNQIFWSMLYNIKQAYVIMYLYTLLKYISRLSIFILFSVHIYVHIGMHILST